MSTDGEMGSKTSAAVSLLAEDDDDAAAADTASSPPLVARGRLFLIQRGGGVEK